jgi:hypothetical protein
MQCLRIWAFAIAICMITPVIKGYCDGCMPGTTGPCKGTDSVCYSFAVGESCPIGTAFCATPTPTPTVRASSTTGASEQSGTDTSNFVCTKCLGLNGPCQDPKSLVCSTRIDGPAGIWGMVCPAGTVDCYASASSSPPPRSGSGSSSGGSSGGKTGTSQGTSVIIGVMVPLAAGVAFIVYRWRREDKKDADSKATATVVPHVDAHTMSTAPSAQTYPNHVIPPPPGYPSYPSYASQPAAYPNYGQTPEYASYVSQSSAYSNYSPAYSTHSSHHNQGPVPLHPQPSINSFQTAEIQPSPYASYPTPRYPSHIPYS